VIAGLMIKPRLIGLTPDPQSQLALRSYTEDEPQLAGSGEA